MTAQSEEKKQALVDLSFMADRALLQCLHSLQSTLCSKIHISHLTETALGLQEREKCCTVQNGSHGRKHGC